MGYAFSFFGGLAALLASPALPPPGVVIAVGLLAFIGGLWCGRSRLVAAVCGSSQRARSRLGAVVCGACCGYVFGCCSVSNYLAHRWPDALADERVVGSVVIDSIPAPLDGGWAFDGLVRMERPERPPAGAP